MKHTLVILSLALSLAACADPAGPASDQPTMLQTEASFYRMASGGGRRVHVAIPFTYTNRTGGPVYVPCSNVSYSLERSTGRGWMFVWAPATPLSCTIRPIVIGEGATYSGSHAIFASVTGGDDVPLSGINGTYRFRWNNLSRHDASTLVPGTEVGTTSNEFTLVAP
jgi:hypothetical protein